MREVVHVWLRLQILSRKNLNQAVKFVNLSGKNLNRVYKSSRYYKFGEKNMQSLNRSTWISSSKNRADS